MLSDKLSLLLRSLSWNFISTITIFASKFVFSLYLAKLLGPEIIGTYILYLITIEMLSFMNDFGFGAQYFRRKDQTDIKSFAGTAIVLNALRP